MWYKHMQTAISINSCYRRAVQHTTRWIYSIRGVQGGHQNEGEKGQQIFIDRFWVGLAELGQMQPGCFSVVMLSQSDCLSYNSQRAWLHEDVEAGRAHEVLCFAFLLCDGDSSHRSIAPPGFCNGNTDKFCKSKKFDAVHQE